ncbi:MAG: hypothetical protein ACI4M3_05075 [Acutalibacteraceae bacterium]
MGTFIVNGQNGLNHCLTNKKLSKTAWKIAWLVVYIDEMKK